MINLGNKKIKNIIKGTAPIAKVFRGTVLIWQAVTTVFSDYVNRVLADYGIIEDLDVLDTVVVDEDAIATYNPNAGHRTGKIYNLNNTTGIEPTYDLTVTGGGGTRINKEGLIENIQYNLLPYTITSVSSGTVISTNNIAPDNTNTATLLEATSTTNYYFWRILEGNMTDPQNISIYAKAVTGYPIIIVGFNGDVKFDLQTGQITENFENYAATIEDVGEGWYRCSVSVPAEHNEDMVALKYRGAAAGDQILIWGKQWVRGEQELKPLQLWNGTPAFPKIDYSTGKPAFLIEPTRTNLIANSKGAFWNNNYNVTVTTNQIGITGEDNTASLLEDASGTLADVKQITYNQQSAKYYKFNFWIKKDSNETRFPAFAVHDGGATQSLHRVLLNTKTGASLVVNNDGSAQHYILDRGDWWELVIIRGDGVFDIVDFRMYVSPAYSNTFAAGSITSTTGSIILGHVGAYANNNTINETPIITNGAAVTRTKTVAETLMAVPTTFGVYMDLIVRPNKDATGQYIWNFGDNSNWGDNRFVMMASGGGDKLQPFVRKDGVTTANLSFDITPMSRCKTYVQVDDSGNAKFFLNGVLVKTASGITLPTMDGLCLGNYKASQIDSYQAYTDIYDFRVLPPMTDQEAIQLTTI